MVAAAHHDRAEPDPARVLAQERVPERARVTGRLDPVPGRHRASVAVEQLVLAQLLVGRELARAGVDVEHPHRRRSCAEARGPADRASRLLAGVPLRGAALGGGDDLLTRAVGALVLGDLAGLGRAALGDEADDRGLALVVVADPGTCRRRFNGSLCSAHMPASGPRGKVNRAGGEANLAGDRYAPTLAWRRGFGGPFGSGRDAGVLLTYKGYSPLLAILPRASPGKVPGAIATDTFVTSQRATLEGCSQDVHRTGPLRRCDMGTKAERSGWFQRRGERRALADHPAHEDVEAQLRALSTQWRRGIASHTTGLRPRVDLAHDNVRGPEDAKVTLVEYGDYEST